MKITNYKEINKNSLKSVMDIELASGFMIHGALLMTGSNGPWINFPGIPQYKDGAPYLKDGKQVYKPVLTIPDRDRRDKFSAQVIEALKSDGHYNG